MKFRPITLRKENIDILEFYPENIQKIIFESNKIILYYWEDKLNSKSTTKIILNKKDYYYLHWRYFISQLITIFDIEEFNYEK